MIKKILLTLKVIYDWLLPLNIVRTFKEIKNLWTSKDVKNKALLIMKSLFDFLTPLAFDRLFKDIKVIWKK